MMKICDESMARDLSLLFQRSFLPVHKKAQSKFLKLLLHILIISKMYEKIISCKIYTFFLNEQLLNHVQSGFRPSDSCVN